MPYEEAHPRMPSIAELTTMHNVAAAIGAELTADILMESYWLRRTDAFPIEESQEVTVPLQTYDQDWERLIAAGEEPLTENDPRIGSVSDDADLPVWTSIRPSVLFDDREALITRHVASAEGKLVELRHGLQEHVSEAIDKVGVDRVNRLLGLLGVTADETGGVTYDDIDAEQLEGVRKVARLMAGVYRDFVRMNRGLVESSDLGAVVGTGIEDPDTRVAYEALLKALGIEDI